MLLEIIFCLTCWQMVSLSIVILGVDCKIKRSWHLLLSRKHVSWLNRVTHFISRFSSGRRDVNYRFTPARNTNAPRPCKWHQQLSVPLAADIESKTIQDAEVSELL